METTKKFAISSTGASSGKSFAGGFTVKTILTRQDRFDADRIRRDILGVGGQEALPDLQMEAFVLGQLAVRIVDAPDWWRQSEGGKQLEDANVITEIWNLTRAKEDEAQAELKKESEAALKSLAKGK